VLATVLALVFVGGWALTVLSDTHDLARRLATRWNGAYLAAYAFFTRELYLNDIYVRSGEILTRLSRRLNLMLRWL